METHKRVGVSECCGYATEYWQAPARTYTCKKCKKECFVKGIDLPVFEVINRGHYRPIDNSKIGF